MWGLLVNYLSWLLFKKKIFTYLRFVHYHQNHKFAICNIPPKFLHFIVNIIVTETMKFNALIIINYYYLWSIIINIKSSNQSQCQYICIFLVWLVVSILPKKSHFLLTIFSVHRASIYAWGVCAFWPMLFFGCAH